jgi:uncharacterized membrane protein affecting hemolysin expression
MKEKIVFVNPSEEIKALRVELSRYKGIVDAALKEYQLKTLAESKRQQELRELKRLESETRSRAQQLRRYEEDLQRHKDALVSAWRGFK